MLLPTIMIVWFVVSLPIVRWADRDRDTVRTELTIQ